VTTDPCRDWRGALGAAALGRIDPAEELALRAHLDGCAGCRDELRDLTAVARALDAVPVENVVSAPAEPPSALGGRVLARVAEERDARRTRRVRRYAAAATAFTAAAAAVIALVLVLGGGGSSPGTRVVLVSTLGATEVEMQVAGLRPGHYYWAWITGDDGRRIPAGTFSGSRSSTKLHLMAAVPLNEASRIWVTDDQHRVVLDRHLPSN
jgi:hypothetical protein